MLNRSRSIRFSLLAAVTTLLFAPHGTAQQMGRPDLHQIGVRTLEGHEVSIAPSDRPTALFLFGTWCYASKHHAQRLKKEVLPSYGDRVNFLAVACGDTAGEVRAFFEECGELELPVFLAPGRFDLARQFGPAAIPKLVVFDPEGHFVWEGLDFASAALRTHLVDEPAAWRARAVQVAEPFRRRLLADRGGFSRADLVARAVQAFKEVAPRHLNDRPDLDAFALHPEAIVAAIAGRRPVQIRQGLEPFADDWYGVWDGMTVDHRWGRYHECAMPEEVAGPGWSAAVLGWQHAWVGDGHGLNLLVRGDEGPVVLGYVEHLNLADSSRVRLCRPLVGVVDGPGRLIWIAESEVFLEEVADVDGWEAYVITGFRYRLEGDRLEVKEGFQAVYRSLDETRRPWHRFPLDLRVDGSN